MQANRCRACEACCVDRLSVGVVVGSTSLLRDSRHGPIDQPNRTSPISQVEFRKSITFSLGLSLAHRRCWSKLCGQAATARAVRPGRRGQGDAASAVRPGRCGQDGAARARPRRDRPTQLRKLLAFSRPEALKSTLGGAKVEPRSTLGGTKIEPRSPRRVKERPKSIPGAPKSVSRAFQERPRAPQERHKNGQERTQSAQERPKSHSGAPRDAPESLRDTI